MSGNARAAVAFVASLTAGAAVVVGLTVLMGRGLLCIVVIPVCLVAFHVRDAAPRAATAALAGILAAPLLVFGAHSARLVAGNVAHPPEWDLGMWSVYGHAAVAGVDFYTPESIRAAAPAADYSPAFVDDVFATAFPFPPPTMLLLLPFGWWSLRTAAAVWYALNGLALLAAVGVAWRLFVPGSGTLGLLLVATLTVILRATQSNVALGQWNFLALLFVLLFWRDQGRARAGAWLGGAVFLRTFLVALLAHPLRRREWRTLGAFGATVAGLGLLAVAVFGAPTCAAYLGTVSDGFLPFVYTESINLSLLATILRMVGFDPTQGSPLANPVYLGVGGVMTAVTGWLVWRLPEAVDWMPGLALSLALLVYPVTLEHYGVLVLPPTLAVWQRSRRGGAVGWWGVVFVTLVFTFLGVDEGRRAFLGLVLVWAAHVGLGIAESRR